MKRFIASLLIAFSLATTGFPQVTGTGIPQVPGVLQKANTGVRIPISGSSAAARGTNLLTIAGQGSVISADTIELGTNSYTVGSIPSVTPRYVGLGPQSTITITGKTKAEIDAAGFTARCFGLIIVASDGSIDRTGLKSSANLSDVTSASESRTNIGAGDVSSNTSTSVVNEIALFADTSGKLFKRSSGTGIATLTGGVLSATSTTGTGTVVLHSAPTLLTPKFTTIADPTHSLTTLLLNGNAGAVNTIAITNAATGFSPLVSAEGDDSNVDLDLRARGTGTINLLGTDTSPGILKFFEDADGGTNRLTLTPAVDPSGFLSGNFTVTIPAATDQLVARATTDTLTNKTLTAPKISSIYNTAGFQTLEIAAPGGTPVNYFTMTPTGSGIGVLLSASGSDTNIDLRLRAKGSGAVSLLPSSSSTTAELRLYEPTESGTNYVALRAPFGPLAPGSDTTYMLPSEYPGTASSSLVSGTTGILSWVAPTGTGNVVRASTPTITGPKINLISDQTHGLTTLLFSGTAGAVNTVQISNAATGNNPMVSAEGDDSNVDLSLRARGTGAINILGTSTGQGRLKLFEDTDNGAHSITLVPAASISADFTLTVPSVTSTLATLAGTETLTNKTLTTPKMNVVYDSNGATVLLLTATGGAINTVGITNAATGNAPLISAEGDDTNVDLSLRARGTGAINLLGTATTPAVLKLFEDTDDGTNWTAFKVGTQSGNVTYTLPTALPAGNGYSLISDTSGTLSWADVLGSGDFSSNTATSVDGEIVLFSGAGGKTGKRATGTGIAKLTNGVLSASTTTGTGAVVLTSNPTLLAPRIDTITDSGNGLTTLLLTGVPAAVNTVAVTNSATGNNPMVSAEGDDTNLHLNFRARGTGGFGLLGTSNTQAYVRFYEDTDNGSNYVTLTPAASIASNVTLTMPSTSGTLALLTDTAPSTAKYLVQEAHASLPNAVPLAELATGLLHVTTGTGAVTTTRDPNLDSNRDDFGVINLDFGTTTSAVNYLGVINNSTGNAPRFQSLGSDSNVGIDLLVKGAAGVAIKGNSDTQGRLLLYEDTDNGTNHIRIVTDASLSADFINVLPAANDTLVGRATTDTLSNKTLSTGVAVAGSLTWADNTKQTFNPGANFAGINVGSIAGDPDTPANGDLWYDQTANELTARINGSNVALGAGGGSFDATAVDNVTWSDGANASNVWTFDVSGTDATLTFGDALISVGGSLTVSDNITATSGDFIGSVYKIRDTGADHTFAITTVTNASANRLAQWTFPDDNMTITWPTTGTLATLAGTETLTNKTLTTPKIATIFDTNGNEAAAFATTTSAVNHIGLKNAATNTNPAIVALGDDSNVGINFEPKGTGGLRIIATTSNSAFIRFYEDADNGTNYAALNGPNSLAADIELTLPVTTGSLSTVNGTETFTNKTLTSPKMNLIADATNAATAMTISGTAGSVNAFDVTGATTGNNPRLSAVGDDSDVGMNFLTKGAGVFRFLATASGPTDMRWLEDSDNGTNYHSIIGQSSLSADFVHTLPAETGTFKMKNTAKRVSLLNGSVLPDTSGNAFLTKSSDATSNDRWPVLWWSFPDTGSSRISIFGNCHVPTDYTGGATKVVIVWTTSATANNVVWDFDYRAITGNDSESLDQTTQQEQVTVTDAAPGAAWRQLIVTIDLTGSNLAADDTIQWELGRDLANGSDTLAATAYLVDVQLQYTQ